MRKYNLYTVIAVLSMLLCTACYEDKGNYDYKDLPQIVFDDDHNHFVTIDEDGEESSASYLSIRYGETLKIKPAYKLSKEADIDLRFTWKLRDEEGQEIVLGNEETLEWEAKEAMKGRLILDMEDATNGTHFLSDISITISEPYAGMGYLILSEKDGKKMLSFIAGSYMDIDESEYEKNPFEEFINIYEDMNKEALPSNTIKIHEHYHREPGNNGSGQPAQLMAVCEDQLIDFSSSLFTEVTRSSEFFSTPISNIRDVEFMQWLDLVTDDEGHLYQRRKTTDELFHSQKFLSEPVKYKGEVLEGIKLIPGIFSGSYRGFALLYDSKNSRYLTMSDQKFHNWSTSKDESFVGKISEMESESSNGWSEGFTPLNNMDGYEVIYTGSNNLTNDYGGWQCISIIREKASGTYYYQKFEVTHGYNSADTYVTNMEQGEVPAKLAAHITADTKFAMPERFNNFDGSAHPYLFAACGNDLYLYDMQDMEAGVSDALSFDSPITALCCERYAGNFLSVGLEDGNFYVIRTNTAKNYWNWNNKSRLVRYHIDGDTLGKIQGIYYKTDGQMITLSGY